MIKEIGSDFWNDGPVRQDQIYLLSGRTALEFIIRDIIKQHSIRSVLLPSYCCHTMIEPFFRHGISVRFYDVYFDEQRGLSVDVPELQDDEAFYYMTYFGFSDLSGVDLRKIRESCATVIEDKTHSWLNRSSNCGTDYSYVSYRKWTGFDAIALATKAKGFFSELPTKVNKKYSAMRRQAFAIKRAFIESDEGEKNHFLNLFGEAEELLETDYVGYKPMMETMAAFLQLDTVQITESRRRNAEILINGLNDIPEIKLIFQTMNDNDVPLFVPILVRKNRTELRKYLIDNAIYCPIHWPKSTYHDGISKRAEKLYQQELSLICDQRYNSDDMNRIVERIKNYYKR